MKSSAYNYLLLLALLLSALFTGCIREDLETCPELRVHVTYTQRADTRSRGIEAKEVDRFDLFLFDAKGIFQGLWVEEDVTLEPGYFMTIPNQPEGDYRFILWDGVHECYKVNPTDFKVGVTTYDEAYFILERAGNVIGSVPPLFFATKSDHLYNQGEQDVYLPLIQNHNIINLTTEGLLFNDDIYHLSIHDDNGKYFFDDSFADNEPFTYDVTCDKDVQGQLLASLTMLRLAANRHPIIEVTNETKGTTLYREDLVTLLNRLEQIDYDDDHIFDIHLVFGLNISVSINGWQVVDDGKFILK